MQTESDAPPKLEPLKIKCTDADCQSGLHCFLTTGKLREVNKEGRCRYCGVDLIDWPRVHRRNIRDVAFTFEALRRELIRHHFWCVPIDPRAINYGRRKGRKGLREATEKRLRTSVAPAAPPRDGYQTPREGSGNCIHYAQHATASCCRRCVEEWHGIPRGRTLDASEIAYLTELVMSYLEARVSPTDDGERIPPIRRQRQQRAN